MERDSEFERGLLITVEYCYKCDTELGPYY